MSAPSEIEQLVGYLNKIRGNGNGNEVPILDNAYTIKTHDDFKTLENLEGYYLKRSTKNIQEFIIFVPYKIGKQEIGYLQHSIFNFSINGVSRKKEVILSGIEVIDEVSKYLQGLE